MFFLKHSTVPIHINRKYCKLQLINNDSKRIKLFRWEDTKQQDKSVAQQLLKHLFIIILMIDKYKWENWKITSYLYDVFL